jgi:hypothetical protein
MWDPISIFVICWSLNVGLPSSRLDVKEVIKTNHENVISISK